MNKSRMKNPVLFKTWNRSTKYQIYYALVLAVIPLVCGLIMLGMFDIFAELNLYFLEANGFLINDLARDGYFQAVEMEMFDVLGYLGFLMIGVLVAAVIMLRWATAPFISARDSVRAALQGQKAEHPSTWFSEIPGFDRTIHLFNESVRTGERKAGKSHQAILGNYPFLIKFWVAFSILSLVTGFVMSIITESCYRRIVEIALHLIKPTSKMGHYFLSQQDVLQRMNYYVIGLSFLLYFVVGWLISRYMLTMAGVFSRAIHEDRFPISLRQNDLYQDLAETLNEGRKKFN